MVKIGVEAELGCVTFPQKILPVRIRNQHNLIAGIEFVQSGVAVLLTHIERGQIVLPSVIGIVAEKAGAQVDVVEDEAAKIAAERLVPESAGDEIVIIGQVA